MPFTKDIVDPPQCDHPVKKSYLWIVKGKVNFTPIGNSKKQAGLFGFLVSASYRW